MIPPAHSRRHGTAAFTLVELLVVIAVGAIITALSVSVFTQVVKAGALTTAVQSVVGILDQARLSAITHNNYVEVRLYELPDYQVDPASGPLTVYRAVQSFLVTSTGYVPLTKLNLLPMPILFQNDAIHSTLLSGTVQTPAMLAFTGPPAIPAPQLPLYGMNYAAITFRFSPKGSMNLTGSQQWLLTLVNPRDPIIANNLPANYATIQIDAFTGKAAYYRP